MLKRFKYLFILFPVVLFSLISCTRHTHSFSEYKSTESYHYKQCSCGLISDLESHTYPVGTIQDDRLKSTITCVVCNYENEVVKKYQQRNKTFDSYHDMYEYSLAYCDLGASTFIYDLNCKNVLLNKSTYELDIRMADSLVSYNALSKFYIYDSSLGYLKDDDGLDLDYSVYLELLFVGTDVNIGKPDFFSADKISNDNYNYRVSCSVNNKEYIIGYFNLKTSFDIDQVTYVCNYLNQNVIYHEYVNPNS